MALQKEMENGIFLPKAEKYCLLYIDKYMERLKYHISERKMSLEFFESIKNKSEDKDYDKDCLMEMFTANVKLQAVLIEMVYVLAFGLYEFFYTTRKLENNEYAYYQFNIDRKKFEKERLPKAGFTKLLKDKKNIDEDFVELLEKNYMIFKSCLKSKKKKS